MVNKHGIAATLSAALFTGREPDLSSDIKEKFVDLCEKHGIVRENVIDLTKTSKSGPIYFSHPEYFIIEDKPKGLATSHLLKAGEESFFLLGK